MKLKCLGLALLAFGLAACASLPDSARADAPPAAAPRGSDASLKPFADVIRDAQVQDGYFPLWRKDDKVWIEIPADRLNKPFLLTVNISHSVGERGLYASQMGPDYMAEFRRYGNQVQLVALNQDFRAGTDRALQKAVAQAYSDSLIASATAASAAHPERKSFLIDASMLLADVPGYSTLLERAYRLSYNLDRANSSFESVRADARISTLTTRMHFATQRIPAPPPGAGSPMTLPSTVPDPRSLFVGFVYSLSQLPEQPMASRAVDPRLGHFFEAYTDYADDFKANPRVLNIARWRLEKKDPGAALSEPVQPIVYWLDRNIPERYRASVEAGVLAWNAAFERIGFKNAIVVKQQPDDADFDTLDASHASIRWFVGSDVSFAIGPRRSDPRSGEILDADIGISDAFGRGSRRAYTEDLYPGRARPQALDTRHGADLCTYGMEAANEMDFALDVLEARGDIAPDSPEAEAFTQAVIKDVVMHEVGHTLGLKHNFKASTTVSRAQLLDRHYTESHGISGSVMDYNGYNLALKNEPQGAYVNATLGPYDYWAIEYAYKPLDAAAEKEELARIAARSTEPSLAYADDIDAYGMPGADGGMDPMVNSFDLGDDPLAYFGKRLKLSQELWARVQERSPQTGEDPQRRRRVLLSGFRSLARATDLVGKYVGGMYAVRDVPGQNVRPNYRPVEPERQRQALKLLADGLFSADSFRFQPEFLSALTPDYNEWSRPGPVDIPGAVMQMQSAALDRLYSAGTAKRLLDLPGYVPQARRVDAISLNDVYANVQGSIWSELRSGRDISRLRRNLQREHLRRIQTLLTRGSSSLPPDALSLLRMQSKGLLEDLNQAGRRTGLTVETRAHLQESQSLLGEALRATMQRS